MGTRAHGQKKLHFCSVKLLVTYLMLKGEETCREYQIINVFFEFLLIKLLFQDFSGAYHWAQY